MRGLRLIIPRGEAEAYVLRLSRKLQGVTLSEHLAGKVVWTISMVARTGLLR
jgi:hypothetical protein